MMSYEIDWNIMEYYEIGCGMRRHDSVFACEDRIAAARITYNPRGQHHGEKAWELIDLFV